MSKARYFLYFVAYFAVIGVCVLAFIDNDPIVRIFAGLFFIGATISFIQDTWKLMFGDKR